MDASVSPIIGNKSLGAVRALTLWFLFVLISFGLGYPTLGRYDIRGLGPDQQVYYRMVINQAGPDEIPFCFRVLVPEVARPFYLLAKGRVHSWDPVSFALLMSNCLFCATATFLFLLIGIRVLQDLPIALLGCTLYLLNFVVPNLWLSGFVDSSEACLMMAVTWALISGKWWLLPVIGIPGGMAKQSFLLFSATFAGTWWLTEKRVARTKGQIVWVAALGCTCALSVVVVHRLIAGSTMSPWAMAAWWGSDGHYALFILKGFLDQQFWYAFVWLLPLGIWRLNRFPKPWVMASSATALLAIGLGGYAESLGSVNRPLFSIIGPVLTLSAATFIARGPSGNHS